MKNKFLRISIILIAIIIFIVGTIFIFRKQIISQLMPTVEQIGDIHIKVKNDTSYISSKLVVKNHTFLKIEIDTIKYKVSLFDKTYLLNKKYLGILMYSYGEDTIDFSLKIPYLNLVKDLKAERKKGDSTNCSIEIFLQYSTVFGKSEIPFNKTARIKIPQPPEIEVVDIKYSKVRLNTILASAKIRITNFSDFALSIKEMSYSMNISKHGNLNGKFTEPVMIKSNEITFVSIPIIINVNNIGKTIFRIIINKDNYDYTLTLKAVLESADPLNKSFNIDITKKGMMELKK